MQTHRQLYEFTAHTHMSRKHTHILLISKLTAINNHTVAFPGFSGGCKTTIIMNRLNCWVRFWLELRQLFDSSIDRKLIRNFFDNQLIELWVILQANCQNICLFQLLQCGGFLFVCLLNRQTLFGLGNIHRLYLSMVMPWFRFKMIISLRLVKHHHHGYNMKILC